MMTSQHYVIWCMCWPPDAAQWPGVHRRFFDKLNAEHTQGQLTKDECSRRCGGFPAVAVPFNTYAIKKANGARTCVANGGGQGMRTSESATRFARLSWSYYESMRFLDTNLTMVPMCIEC